MTSITDQHVQTETTTYADQQAQGKRTIHVGHAVTVAARMPTAAECARGYPVGSPVLVVTGWGCDKIYPQGYELAFDDPHGQPEADETREAAAYVLGTVSEELANIRGRVGDLRNALRGTPCRVTELAGQVREARENEMYCADVSLCRLVGPAADAT